MKRRILIALMCMALVSMGAGIVVSSQEVTPVTDVEELDTPPLDTFVGQPMEDLNMEEVKLLAAVIWAEAEGEDHTGKRLVASTVLNRVDDARFPNSIYEVIFQKGQFTVIGNGRFDRGYILQEPSCVQAAMEELMARTDPHVLFFCAWGYGYGTPYMKHGNHYFSTLW